MKNKISLLIILSSVFVLSGIITAPAYSAHIEDISYIHAILSDKQDLQEFGPYVCSSIKVWIDTTSPHSKQVKVIIIDYSAPWNKYYENILSEGQNTGWIGLGQTRWVYVQLWYVQNGANEVWGRVEFHYP